MRWLHRLLPGLFPAPRTPTVPSPHSEGVTHLYQEIEAIKPSTEALRQKLAEAPPGITSTLRRARQSAHESLPEGGR